MTHCEPGSDRTCETKTEVAVFVRRGIRPLRDTQGKRILAAPDRNARGVLRCWLNRLTRSTSASCSLACVATSRFETGGSNSSHSRPLGCECFPESSIRPEQRPTRIPRRLAPCGWSAKRAKPPLKNWHHSIKPGHSRCSRRNCSSSRRRGSQ